MRYIAQGEGDVFLDLNGIVADNLKRIRSEKKLSLDKVAEVSGVSKSMLGQIERGESNPTITTLWKIASGLKISFSSLVNHPQPETMVVRKSETVPLEDNSQYRVYSIFPYEEGRRFEIYTIEIEKGGYFNSDAHGDKTEELITVFDGELTVRVDKEEYTIPTGDAIRFRADKPHSYHNSGMQITRVNMVIYYPE